jgi:hypothetical protein
MNDDRRPEPEIIPPRRAGRRGDPAWPPHFADDGGPRIYVAKVGPVGLVLASLLIGIIAAAAIVLFAGALLIWIPVVGLLAAAAAVAGLLRAYLGRAR